MADTTKNLNADKKGKVTVTLPFNKGQYADQTEFFSVNGRNCRIKRGEEVEIREEIAEVIRNGQSADVAAMRYVGDLTEKYSEIKDKLT
jgi:hypothetical protein